MVQMSKVIMTLSSDVKKVFKHMYDTGDARLNAGFLGRAASAELFGQRSNRELQQEMMMNYEEAKRYMPIDKSLAAEAISAADEIGDEMKDVTYDQKLTVTVTRTG